MNVNRKFERKGPLYVPRYDVDFRDSRYQKYLRRHKFSASVTFDAVASGTVGVTGTSVSFTLTMGSLTNGAVVVGLSFYNTLPSGLTVTIGGTSASLITGTNVTSGGGVAHGALYGLATGSLTGAQTVAIGWTAATSCVAGACSFGSVNQATPFTNGTKASSASTNTPSLTVTSTSGDYTICNACATNSNSLSAPTQSQEWKANDQSFEINGAGTIGAGAATVTHAWTDVNSLGWAMMGADIQAATAAVPGTYTVEEYGQTVSPGKWY